jgi:hypothetical protein
VRRNRQRALLPRSRRLSAAAAAAQLQRQHAVRRACRE